MRAPSTHLLHPSLPGEMCSEMRSVTINGHHTHVVLSVRIKFSDLSGCDIWRKKFPDRDAAVAALCSHNEKAYATV